MNSFMTSIIAFYRYAKGRMHQRTLAREWERAGRSGLPPHIIKERAIREYAKQFSARIMIETGTYLGDMVYEMKNRFEKIISIELEEELHKRASKRFGSYSHISVILGDSATVLPQILSKENGRCLFWLDGHYSGGETAKGERETPILEELKHIKAFGDKHVILIDDARLFNGTNDYPEIIDLKAYVQDLWPRNVVDVRDDIIRIHPSEISDATE